MRKGETPRESSAELKEEVARLTQRVSELEEQQAATAEVLKAISRSAFNLQTVLNALTATATRVCEADMGCIMRRDVDVYRCVANAGFSRELAEYAQAHPLMAGRHSGTARAVLEHRTIHIPDVLADPEYVLSDYQRLGGYRTLLAVPLLRDGAPIGVFVLTRPEVNPFTQKQIELLASFADQAVIAIENVRLFEEMEARTEELSGSLKQQAAMADVLKIISRSSFDLQSVLETLAKSVAHLCEAEMVSISRPKGAEFYGVANYGFPAEFDEYIKNYPQRPGRGTTAGRTLLEGKIVQIPDVLADPDYVMTEAQRLGGFRTTLGVPILREGTAIGVMVLTRTRVQPFTINQIELGQTFADQAVIAIENVRLFEEVQARTREVTEALERQTATAEVLKVISRSAFDLQAVLDTLTESAVRLCRADKGGIVRHLDGAMRYVATSGYSPDTRRHLLANPPVPGRGSGVGRVVEERRVVHIPDVMEDPEYQMARAAEIGNFHSLLGVPLLREGDLVGVFVLTRTEVRPFSEKDIELVHTFADQAVIAIENVRLFEEVQARTRELSEALEKQTATSEILRVISTSPTDLQPVFETIVRNAVSLCGSLFANVFRFDGELLHFVASHNVTPGYVDLLEAKYPMRPDASQVSGRVLLTKSVVRLDDALADPAYDQRFPSTMSWRRMLGVPMMREGEPVGVIVVGWAEAGPVPKAQEELLKTFADQAVIAIENARLLDELRESLQRQTATADVLKAISRSAVDLQSVLHTLVESAARLCDAERGTITRRIGGVFYRREAYGHSQEFLEYVKDLPVSPDAGSITGRALLEKRVIHIPDAEADKRYTFSEARRIDPYRTMLGVPMMKEGVPLGVLALTRSEVRPFTQKQIELVSTFADQAAIAIENARLFEEVQTRTDELSRSLEELRTTQDRLVQTEKLASLGQLTAGIAHEIKNPLNFVNNFSSLSTELIGELNDLLRDIDVDAEKRAEIDELAGLLKGNLEKVVQHGKRADSIVKNMLLHSRQGSGEHRPADINAIVEESLNLAYHGARAERQGFNITMEKKLDPAAGEVDVYPQEITRVLLNLISNGFYAATKKKERADGVPYEPTLTATTRNMGESVEIRIRDNGTGIPPEVKEKLFSPFFTTKPAGEGTGLGLSLSHDIVVKQHAGTIEVETEPGRFTEFRIVLPRGAAALGKGLGGQA